jgi:hypothetical protein
VLLELYDEAVLKQEEETGARGVLDRRAALAGRLSELDEERKGYLRQNARRAISDAELDAMLAEVDGEGTLTLQLSLSLDGRALHPELSPPRRTARPPETCP